MADTFWSISLGRSFRLVIKNNKNCIELNLAAVDIQLASWRMPVGGCRLLDAGLRMSTELDQVFTF